MVTGSLVFRAVSGRRAFALGDFFLAAAVIIIARASSAGFFFRVVFHSLYDLRRHVLADPYPSL